MKRGESYSACKMEMIFDKSAIKECTFYNDHYSRISIDYGKTHSVPIHYSHLTNSTYSMFISDTLYLYGCLFAYLTEFLEYR